MPNVHRRVVGGVAARLAFCPCATGDRHKRHGHDGTGTKQAFHQDLLKVIRLPAKKAAEPCPRHARPDDRSPAAIDTITPPMYTTQKGKGKNNLDETGRVGSERGM
jgi:hypothetical protein